MLRSAFEENGYSPPDGYKYFLSRTFVNRKIQDGKKRALTINEMMRFCMKKGDWLSKMSNGEHLALVLKDKNFEGLQKFETKILARLFGRRYLLTDSENVSFPYKETFEIHIIYYNLEKAMHLHKFIPRHGSVERTFFEFYLQNERFVEAHAWAIERLQGVDRESAFTKVEGRGSLL